MNALEDIEDNTNLTGLSSLVNRYHINDKLDLDKIEKSMIGVSGIKIIEESDPAKEFESTIKELSLDTGINLDGVSMGITKKTIPTEPARYTELEEIEEEEYPEMLEEEEEYPEMPEEEYLEPTAPVRKPYRPAPSAQSNYSYQQRPVHNPYYHRPVHSSYRYPNYREEEHFDEVLRAYSGINSDVNLEREKEEDTKAIILEDIDELRAELASDGVDLSRIPEVNQDSPMNLVQSVHKSLRMKYDRKRCNTLGSEIILAGAQGLGYLFNGKRKFGPYAPNLEGWHNTVRPKLRRMKYETSTVVASIMQEYNIGPIARILLELGPSAFLYSHMKKEQTGASGYSKDQMSEAFDDLRQFDSE
jgi:hypothetical protein